MSAPKEIIRLVEQFDPHSGLNETQVRREYLDPFFMALGWDVANKEGRAEAYKDVIHEDAIKVGGATKAPDYCFRIGGTRKFFVEAKKPSINLKNEPSAAYQLRRYAWSAKLPLSILTDFEEFAVYDCRKRPVKSDKSSHSRILYFTYDQYVDRWEELSSIFSHEAVIKGSFDKYATARKKRGTDEVDDAFLKEIEKWRELLAKNIALRNPELYQREINFAVQRTIDRIIFLRICEDRSIEDYNHLMGLTNGSNIYRRLCEYFYRADERYNSGLFHFQKEKDRPDFDALTPKLNIDDVTLKKIIGGLYYPDSPYEFSILPASILGQVYEQFLGKVIHLTAGHHAKIEDKPEVKKAGGVYYTPEYIVDYIVDNTLGKMLEGKTPKQVEKIKVLDPACGSGSFLINAYQKLVDWHRDYYLKSDKPKERKLVYEGPGGVWYLSTPEKKRILLKNIFGVDIDSQAVEVTKLSLLLKVLEGETDQTINAQMKLFHASRALPDLSNNIKCGNSLIGPDFYDARQMSLLENEEVKRINIFDWKAEFSDIMKSGGFDAVVGNPPYVRQEMLGEFKPYFENHYKVYHGVADIYVYFIEKGISLLNANGSFGIIVANKWMRANYGRPLRQWLKGNCIEEILDFGDLPVFQKATTYPCIVIANKSNVQKGFRAAKIKGLEFDSLSTYLENMRFNVSKNDVNSDAWILTDERTQQLVDKIRRQGIPLKDYVGDKIYYGIKTGLNRAFVIDDATRKKLISEDPRSNEIIKPFLVGKNVKRYCSLITSNYLILIPKGQTNQKRDKKQDAWAWFQNSYPAVSRHLKPFAMEAQKRCDKGEYWWELRTCDYYNEFERPKIIYAEIAAKGQFALDDDNMFGDTTTYILGSDSKYLLGVLNSKLWTFLFSKTSSTIRGGFYRWKYQYLAPLPVPSLDLSSDSDKACYDKMFKLVEQMQNYHKRMIAAKLPHEKDALQRQIDATDRQIDQLVYELYGLTEEEIKIVEEGAK